MKMILDWCKKKYWQGFYIKFCLKETTV